MSTRGKGKCTGTEATGTRRFCRALEEHGGYALAFVASHRSKHGIPDRYLAHRRWSGFVEFKHGDGRLTAAQRSVLRELLRRGVPCLVVRFRRDGRVTAEDPEGKELLTREEPGDPAQFLADAWAGWRWEGWPGTAVRESRRDVARRNCAGKEWLRRAKDAERRG